MQSRQAKVFEADANQQTMGRNLFSVMRQSVSSAEQGASFIV
jgi:phosphogluconate dehydratase